VGENEIEQNMTHKNKKASQLAIVGDEL